MNTQLLCTFTTKSELEKTVSDIVSSYEIVPCKIGAGIGVGGIGEVGTGGSGVDTSSFVCVLVEFNGTVS